MSSARERCDGEEEKDVDVGEMTNEACIHSESVCTGKGEMEIARLTFKIRHYGGFEKLVQTTIFRRSRVPRFRGEN